MSAADYKTAAATRALDYVTDGMKLGLGTGSTAARFVELLAARVTGGLDVVCVPTSEATRAQAEALGIRLTTLDDEPELDLAIDGADEVDGNLRLIKGGGGALLREKIVATASERLIVIGDHSKKVTMLGRFPLPIEVAPFGWKSTLRIIEEAASDADCSGMLTLRRAAGTPYRTDNGNLIVDASFGRIADAELLADMLETIPGVVEHGLFIDIAALAILAGPAGIAVITAEDDA